MEQLDQIIALIALSMGVGWASGINLYATLLALGVMSHTGHMVLPPELQILADPLVMMAAGLMYMVEFTADKIPGVDSIWDTIHSFIRLPAGAILAASAIGDASPALEVAAAIVGGGLAAASHLTKAGGRVIINSSPEPFSNGIVSLGEDIAVFFGLWVAIQHPLLFLILLAAFILLVVWLLPKLWAAARAIFTNLKRAVNHSDDSAQIIEPPLLDKK